MSPRDDTFDVCFPTDKKYLHHIIHALFCTDEMTLNILVPHTPLPYINCSENTLDYCESYKYLGVWMDEHLTFNKNVKELVKAASRVLGSLMTKVNIAGGMTYKVHPSRHQDIYMIHNNLEYFQSIEK
jgi:hypothetical protein